MKTLIADNVLARFLDNYSDKEYEKAYEKLKSYQDEAVEIKKKSERTFQSEFLAKVFDGILGYKSSATNSLKSSNLLVEHKNPNNGESTDGVIIDKYQDVKMVVELKSVKDTTHQALISKKRGGSDGKTPLQQAAVYLFQFPKAELAVVSNFDSVIIFDKKEAYRQEFSLFDMDFEEFKEFYLILSAESFFGGITKLLIDQTESEEKMIDDDFFYLAKSIHNSLTKKVNEKYVDDLFNKFLAMAILEDSAKLPNHMIKQVYDKKHDFDQSLKTHWEVFKTFFQTMKNGKNSRDALGIDETIAALPVWQDTSYLGRITVPKAILDQVVLLSEYNLRSIPLDRLFYGISEVIHNQYDAPYEVEDNFAFYKELLADHWTPIDECLSFACGRGNLEQPLIQLYNQLSTTKIVTSNPVDKMFTMKYSYNEGTDWFSVVEKSYLEEPMVVTDFINNLVSIEIVEIDGIDFALLGSTSFNTKEFTVTNGDEHFEMSKKGLTKIKILSKDEKEWLETYKNGSQALTKFITICEENEADYYFRMIAGDVFTKDEFGVWNDFDVYEFDGEYKVYFKSDLDDIDVILSSSDFKKYLDLTSAHELNYATLSQHILSEAYLYGARRLKDVKTNISLYEYKLDKLQANNGPETEVMRIEMQLDNLYAQEKELMTDES